MATKRSLEQMLITSRNEARQLRAMLARCIEDGAALQQRYDRLVQQRIAAFDKKYAHLLTPIAPRRTV